MVVVEVKAAEEAHRVALSDVVGSGLVDIGREVHGVDDVDREVDGAYPVAVAVVVAGFGTNHHLEIEFIGEGVVVGEGGVVAQVERCACIRFEGCRFVAGTEFKFLSELSAAVGAELGDAVHVERELGYETHGEVCQHVGCIVLAIDVVCQFLSVGVGAVDVYGSWREVAVFVYGGHGRHGAERNAVGVNRVGSCGVDVEHTSGG